VRLAAKQRAIGQSVGGYDALIVDAKGEEAKSFYRRYGFRPYLDTANSLYPPLGG